MPRIRTVKPEFFTSEDIVSLSPLARLLYIALWCEADRDGRFAWKPKTFKMRYFPGDSCSIEKLCDELRDSGLVLVYLVNEIQYAFIPTFHAHQHINPREQKSQLPEPPANVLTTRESRVNDASARDSDAQGGREGKGKEGEGASVSPPDGVSIKVWADFLKLRKTLKAPVTETAMAGIQREALKAGMNLEQALTVCIERSWRSFKSDWLGDQPAKQSSGLIAGAI